MTSTGSNLRSATPRAGGLPCVPCEGEPCCPSDWVWTSFVVHLHFRPNFPPRRGLPCYILGSKMAFVVDGSGGGSLAGCCSRSPRRLLVGRVLGSGHHRGDENLRSLQPRIAYVGEEQALVQRGNSSTGEVVTTPTVFGGLSAAVAGFCVSAPPWRPGNRSVRCVLKTVMSGRISISSSVTVSTSCFRGMIASSTLADISTCQSQVNTPSRVDSRCRSRAARTSACAAMVSSINILMLSRSADDCAASFPATALSVNLSASRRASRQLRATYAAAAGGTSGGLLSQELSELDTISWNTSDWWRAPPK